MRGTLRSIAVIVATAGLVAVSPAAALANDSFGEMVAMCAKAHLGERPNTPTVTCVCNDRTMTFANFGTMVQHMKDMGCTNCTTCG